jgi:hypothetical protein
MPVRENAARYPAPAVPSHLSKVISQAAQTIHSHQTVTRGEINTGLSGANCLCPSR